jgi:hypothetical protein
MRPVQIQITAQMCQLTWIYTGRTRVKKCVNMEEWVNQNESWSEGTLHTFTLGYDGERENQISMV